MHAPAQVLPRSPSPNGQARSAKALDQKGNREHEKPQSNSTPRDEVRRDESSPAKGRPSQPKASAETSVQKPENIQPPTRNRERAVAQEKFSPVADVRPNSMSKTRALEDLLDLTGQVAYPKLPPSTALGDCNKNLIEGMCSPGSETKVIANNPPASSKLNIQTLF
uniref:Uncharacterized protein n=1 Tax=Electrophorus electricus TaxID=8005 RepID=A0A4W4GF14_ELEEL